MRKNEECERTVPPPLSFVSFFETKKKLKKKENSVKLGNGRREKLRKRK